MYRPGDEAISEPVEFRYKPCCNINTNRKRPRVASYYDSDIPVVVAENTFVRSQADSCVPQSENTLDDSDFEQIFTQLCNSSQSDLALNPEGE